MMILYSKSRTLSHYITDILFFIFECCTHALKFNKMNNANYKILDAITFPYMDVRDAKTLEVFI